MGEIGLIHGIFVLVHAFGSSSTKVGQRDRKRSINNFACGAQIGDGACAQHVVTTIQTQSVYLTIAVYLYRYQFNKATNTNIDYDKRSAAYTILIL